MTNREWNTGVATGLLRFLVGASLLRWRRPLAQRLAGAAPDDNLLPLLFGYFGLRDMTLGVVTLAATRPDGDVPKQVRRQGVADATDAALIGAVMARGRLSRERGIVAIAVAALSALGEFATALQLRRG
ncbi:MAG TPA: hypothetical protein VFH54_06205 [Mycobacteriales bacterium]|nr:hypothetical protein [Mycobacteriales bacterium]